jgi:hypothetical protein
MGVVTIAEAWPTVSRPFTVYDLDRMPDDGRRHELVDGVLFVSPLRQLRAVRADVPVGSQVTRAGSAGICS